MYVSTRNHDHATLAAAALDSGRHVVIDKPAVMSPARAGELLDLAARRGRLVAEATVYPWHPQFDRVRALVAEWGPVRQIIAAFCIPPLAPDNFRYRAAHGGGVLWDLGPYAVSAGRLFFDAPAERIVAGSTTVDGDEVETGFSAWMRYPGDRTLVGQFGMTTAYLNRLDLLGPRFRITVERAFSSAVDLPTAGRRLQVAQRRGDIEHLQLALHDSPEHRRNPTRGLCIPNRKRKPVPRFLAYLAGISATVIRPNRSNSTDQVRRFELQYSALSEPWLKMVTSDRSWARSPCRFARARRPWRSASCLPGISTQAER